MSNCNKLAKYSSHTEPTQETIKLNWRDDPESNFSDWIIEIASENHAAAKTTHVDVYHVHKTILAFGARRCDYFTKLFQSCDKFIEGQKSRSRIVLEASAAEAFPVMLDYMYQLVGPYHGDFYQLFYKHPQMAASLYYLGDYFRNQRLLTVVLEYFKALNKMKHFYTHYKQAKLFHCEAILGILAEKGVEHFWTVCDEIDNTDVQFVANLFAYSYPRPSNEASHRMSMCLAEVCEKNVETLDENTFTKITNSCPIMSVKTALRLAIVEGRIRKGKDGPTPFKTRCLLLLKKSWKAGTLDGRMDLLKRQDPSFLTELFLQLREWLVLSRSSQWSASIKCAIRRHTLLCSVSR